MVSFLACNRFNRWANTDRFGKDIYSKIIKKHFRVRNALDQGVVYHACAQSAAWYVPHCGTGEHRHALRPTGTSGPEKSRRRRSAPSLRCALEKGAQVVEGTELGGFGFLRATRMNFVSGFFPISGLGGRQILGLPCYNHHRALLLFSFYFPD